MGLCAIVLNIQTVHKKYGSCVFYADKEKDIITLIEYIIVISIALYQYLHERARLLRY
jgi:type III secretory pathway component EscV